jgi:DNA-binding transcriptional MerR regulator
MDGWEWFALTAMLVLIAIMTLLTVQYLQLSKIGQLLEHWQAANKEPQRRIGQQAELHSALRAEKAHVQQLLRKVEILQAMLPTV